MDDERATVILDMLSNVHGELTALSMDDCEAAERLDIIEHDLGAILPLVAEGLGAMVDLKHRIERLEAMLPAG